MFDEAARSWPHDMFKEITILAASNIWKIRNRCYFDKIPASLGDWPRLLKADLSILSLRLPPHTANWLIEFRDTLVV